MQEAAYVVGKVVGQKALEKGITQVCFDRGGFLYHGRVKAPPCTDRSFENLSRQWRMVHAKLDWISDIEGHSLNCQRRF